MPGYLDTLGPEAKLDDLFETLYAKAGETFGLRGNNFPETINNIRGTGLHLSNDTLLGHKARHKDGTSIFRLFYVHDDESLLDRKVQLLERVDSLRGVARGEEHVPKKIAAFQIPSDSFMLPEFWIERNVMGIVSVRQFTEAPVPTGGAELDAGSFQTEGQMPIADLGEEDLARASIVSGAIARNLFIVESITEGSTFAEAAASADAQIEAMS